MMKMNYKFYLIKKLSFINSNRRIWSTIRSCIGLTIIELVTAIAIITVIAGIGIPSYISFRNKSKFNRTITELQSLEAEIFTYEGQTGELPDSLADLGIAPPTDPWGQPYRYLRIDGGTTPGINGKRRRDKNADPVNSDYDLYSMGPDGETQAQFMAQKAHDDIVRANDGDYFGLAEDH